MISGITQSFDGSQIEYWASASQPRQPLVLIHGWACDAEFWKFQQDEMSRCLDVVLINLAGHGKSTAGEREWSMIDFARDVLAVLAVIGATKWVLAGHSMGGAVALELARLEPVRTQAVIGVDSFTYDAFYRRSTEDVIENALRPYREDFPRAVHDGMGALFLTSCDKERKDWICDAMARSQEAPALASLAGLLRWDVDEVLNEVSVPVVCISASAFLEPSAVERLRDKISIEEMSNVGHFLMLEDSQVFNDKLLRAASRYLSLE